MKSAIERTLALLTIEKEVARREIMSIHRPYQRQLTLLSGHNAVVVFITVSRKGTGGNQVTIEVHLIVGNVRDQSINQKNQVRRPWCPIELILTPVKHSATYQF